MYLDATKTLQQSMSAGGHHWVYYTGILSRPCTRDIAEALHLDTVINSSPLDKMAAILADDIFKCIFLNENDRIPIQVSLKFVPRSPIDNRPALVQHCRLFGAKPLPEPMLAQFPGVYTCGTRGGGGGGGWVKRSVWFTEPRSSLH